MQSKSILLLAFLSTTFLFGCQKEVEKERMEAVATWSTAMCACAQKSGTEAVQCKNALKEPPDPGGETGLGGQPKYKLESLKAWIEIHGKGVECKYKIGS